MNHTTTLVKDKTMIKVLQTDQELVNEWTEKHDGQELFVTVEKYGLCLWEGLTPRYGITLPEVTQARIQDHANQLLHDNVRPYDWKPDGFTLFPEQLTDYQESFKEFTQRYRTAHYEAVKQVALDWLRNYSAGIRAAQCISFTPEAQDI